MTAAKPQPSTPEQVFLDEVYALTKRGASRVAMTRIFDFMDDHLLEGDFATCDRVLTSVDLRELDPTTALGFLSITLQARGKLSRRQEYLQRVETYLMEERSAEYVTKLLAGLR